MTAESPELTPEPSQAAWRALCSMLPKLVMNYTGLGGALAAHRTVCMFCIMITRGPLGGGGHVSSVPAPELLSDTEAIKQEQKGQF